MNQKAIKMSLIADMEPMISLDPELLLALPTSLVLEPHTVHVWAFTLGGSAALTEACRDVLSPTERQRADRFVFAHDRTHHIVAHGVREHEAVGPLSLGWR